MEHYWIRDSRHPPGCPSLRASWFKTWFYLNLNPSKCNLSVRKQEGGAVGGVAEGLSVICASVICPSVNRREEQ